VSNHVNAAFDVEAGEDGTVRPAPAVDVDDSSSLETLAPPPSHEEEDEAPEPYETDLLKQQAETRTPKKRGRPRKEPPPGGTGGTGGVSAPGRAPAPPPERVVKMANASFQEPDLDDIDSWPHDAQQLWPILLKWLARKGIGPEAITISVERTLVGPVASQPLKLSAIPGAAVAEQPPYSAGDMLLRYVVDVYHAVGGMEPKVGPRSPGCGPAKYKLEFHYAAGGGGIKTGYMTLASYVEMVASREAAARFQGASEARSVEGTWHGAPYASPPYGRPSTAPTAPPPPQQPIGAALDRATYEELGYLRALKDEAVRAAAEGRAPVIGAPPVITPSLEDEEKRVARIVQAALAAAGIKPVSEEEKLARLLQTSNETLMKNIIALYGPPGAPAPSPAPPAPQAAATVENTVDSLKSLLGQLTALDKAREQFKEALGIVEETEDPAATPSQIVVEQKPQSFFDKAVALLQKLPPGAIPAVLAGIGTALEGSPAGALLQKAATAATAAAAAAPAPGRNTSWGGPSAG
jgi:hypothetical protein